MPDEITADLERSRGGAGGEAEDSQERLPSVRGLNISGSTLKDNARAFSEVGFRPRAAVLHDERMLATTVLGQPIAIPVIVSPVGGLRLAHRDGEPRAASAAHALDIPIVVSTMSSRPIEDVIAATSTPVWYQLYVAGGRSAADGAIARTKAAGCAALVPTVDLLSGPRSSNRAARDQIPTKITVRNALRYFPEMVVRPRWLFDSHGLPKRGRGRS